MARKKAKAAVRRVIIDKAFTYQLDTARSRTLPAGWRGPVNGELADLIEAEGHGRILEEDAPAETGGAKKGAAAGGEASGADTVPGGTGEDTVPGGGPGDDTVAGDVEGSVDV